jgi:hypothetical protein
MKKLFVILSLFIALPALAQTLNGNIEYNVDTVRKIAFEGVQYKIDKAKYITPNLFDPNAKENKYALRNNIALYDRDLEQLKTKGLTAYVVTYKSDPFYSFYYLGNILIGIDVNEQEHNTIYPNKSYSYNTKGDLVYITVNISYGDNYRYDKNGNLNAHCKGDICYSNSGKIIGTRKVIEAYN